MRLSGRGGGGALTGGRATGVGSNGDDGNRSSNGSGGDGDTFVKRISEMFMKWKVRPDVVLRGRHENKSKGALSAFWQASASLLNPYPGGVAANALVPIGTWRTLIAARRGARHEGTRLGTLSPSLDLGLTRSRWASARDPFVCTRQHGCAFGPEALLGLSPTLQMPCFSEGGGG